MTNINKKLTKRITSNKYSNDILSKGFNKLAKTEDPINIDKIKDIYDNLFFNIPKNGKKSHKFIIEESDNYINEVANRKIDQKNTNLIKKISSKESELLILENPASNEHPVYEDGALLVAGEGGQQYQDMDTVYVMQEGRKRGFTNSSLISLVKKAFKLPLTDDDGRYFLTIGELNSLPDGPEINKSIDFHLKGPDLIVDLPDILGVSATTEVEFECLGNELSDYIWTDHHTESDLGVNNLQFYLGNESCVIKYIKDTYINDETGPSVLTATIPKGEKLKIKLLRETDMENNMIPSNMNSYYDEETPVNISYNGNDITNYTRNWGPFGDGSAPNYPSVVYADGRIMSQEVSNTHVANSMLLLGDVQDTGQHLFNGLQSQATGVWGEADIVLIDDPSYTGQERSMYGTKMIYNIPGTYGALNQSNDVQRKVFDNRNSIYYKPSANGKLIYGQPIIRYNNHYCVLIRGYKSGLTRYVEFLKVDGTSHSTFKKKRRDVEDAIGIVMEYSGGTVYGFRWDTLHKSRVKYIGLQEFKTNYFGSDDNFFNPVAGSNYGMNAANSANI